MITAGPPFKGESAGPALDALSALSFNRTLDFVEQLDYGQMVSIAMTRPSTLDDPGAAGLLDIIRIWPDDGPDLLDHRDFPVLLSATANSYEFQLLTELKAANLISVDEVAGPTARHVKTSGPFSVQAWRQACANETRVDEATVPVGLESELVAFARDATIPLPRQFAEIDVAIAATYGFGLRQIFSVLASVETMISGKGDFVLIDPPSLAIFLGVGGRDLGHGVNTDAVIAFLTVPFKYEGNKRRHRFRYGLGWARPLFEMPPGWKPTPGRHMKVTGGLFNPFDPPARLIASAVKATRNAWRVWLVSLMDGEWLHPDEPSGPIKSAFRNRRSIERSKIEFESEVAERLRRLGMAVYPNLLPGNGRVESLSMKLRNEIDVLALDAARQTIWVVEAKDQYRCLTVSNVVTRLNEYCGTYEEKMDRKVEDVTGGVEQLGGTLGTPLDSWNVRGLYMTRHVDPASFDDRLRHPVIRIADAHKMRSIRFD